ncbi:MAG TPA: cytochrome d ubiquinol oxidase subunit II [Solirubrobacteraceae bacterium]|nr:cytochrome d ubiquinol oxidase subunit II [Solirubrobacteraceae bacterium]
MSLHTLWFILLAILWVGFFVLEGFDLGVGMLHAIVGRTEVERRAALNTVGPWWDGNEVWLIVAGAGTFAAFPAWYATMFSSLYLALLLVLAALIARGVAFEFRSKYDNATWRETWMWLMSVGSLLIPLLVGTALGDLLNGLPINANGVYTGNFFDLLTPYGLWTGVTLTCLCLLHGAIFLRMRTTGAVAERARALTRPLGWAAIALVVGFVVFTRVVVGHTQVPEPVQVLAIIAVIFAARLAFTEGVGWAFTSSAVAIAATVGSLFIDLYPRVMVSSTSGAYSLTVSGAASGEYALKVMTIVAVILLPVVLAYQGWSFWVFRARVVVPDEPAAPSAPPAVAPPDAPVTPG